jgi:amino acid transporter
MMQKENRFLGFWSMVLLGINGIIGSGIFLLPGQVMSLAGNWSIVVYLFVTLLVLSIAWCFAQCAALFNRNGGAYIYAKEAFGDFIGFVIGIMRWVVGILAWASIVVGFITALSSIWPPVMQEPFRSILILSIVGSLGLLNIFGVQLFKFVNNLVAVVKLIPLIIFVLIGVFYIQQEHYTPLLLDELDAKSFGSAALVIFYAFGGFEALVVAAGEMKNPQKNLPLAMMIVIAFCSSLYFIIQLLAIGLLGEGLAESVTPLADAAQMLLGESGKWFVTLAMLISIGGINLTASFITPRSGVALAEDGMIPKWIADKGRFGTPVWAILLTVGLTGILALSGSFAQLVVISVVSRFAQYISTCLALCVFSRKLDLAQSSFKRWCLTIIPIFALFGIGWLIFQATLSQIIWGLGALILGCPLYWVQKFQRVQDPIAHVESLEKIRINH